MDWCARLGLRDVDIAASGARLRVHVGGHGPALILLHGNPTHGFLWRKVLPDLTARFECHVIDLAGFGASSMQADWGIGEHARAVTETIESFLPHASSLTWLAHDWGCAIALHATRLLPQRQHALALTEGHLRWLPPWNRLDPGFAGLFSALRQDDFGEEFVVRRNAFVDEVLLGSLPHLLPEEREEYQRPFRDLQRRRSILSLARQVPVAGDPPSMAPVLEAIGAAFADPGTTVLLMTADPGSVLDASAVAAVSARSAQVTVATLGPAEHFTPEQQPRAIARALVEWRAHDL